MNEFLAQPIVSIIMVSYRTGPVLAKAIRSITTQTASCELILVDNTEDKAHAEALTSYCSIFDNITLITGQKNIGFARGCNLGAEVAKGEYVLLLNPDCVLETNSVELFLSESRELTGSWVLGADLRDPDNTLQQGCRRELLTPWLALVDHLKLNQLAPHHPYFRKFNRHTEPLPIEKIEVPAISGACMFLKREDYLNSKGMDEIYFLHVEDLDYCLRHHLAGGKIYFSPKVRITHHKSSSRVSPIFVEYHKTRSVCTYFKRHFSNYYPIGFIQFVAMLAVCKFLLFSIASIPKLLTQSIVRALGNNDGINDDMKSDMNDCLSEGMNDLQQLPEPNENSRDYNHFSPRP